MPETDTLNRKLGASREQARKDGEEDENGYRGSTIDDDDEDML